MYRLLISLTRQLWCSAEAHDCLLASHWPGHDARHHVCILVCVSSRKSHTVVSGIRSCGIHFLHLPKSPVWLGGCNAVHNPTVVLVLAVVQHAGLVRLENDRSLGVLLAPVVSKLMVMWLHGAYIA
jgi:hypothetical protein